MTQALSIHAPYETDVALLGASDQDMAFLALGQRLKASGYQFTTVTPATHQRVLGHGQHRLRTSNRDVFGWNREYNPDFFDAPMHQLLRASGELDCGENASVSKIRFATHGAQLFLHSGYPTRREDSVFFGPDTYRFLRFIESIVQTKPPSARIADIGTGSGAAAIRLAQLFPTADVVAADISLQALRYTAINSALNGTANVSTLMSDVVGQLDDGYDLIVSNPPYLVDAARRRYRHGGGPTGAALSLRILTESVSKLSLHGCLILYTGVAIIDGHDEFKKAAETALRSMPWRIEQYIEIDPDVFGEELDMPAYAATERIAVVGVVVSRRSAITREGQRT